MSSAQTPISPMQPALQPFVDTAISKTNNLQPETAFEEFHAVSRRPYDLGLEGCTAFRSNPITGTVLESAQGPAHRCC